MNKNCAKLQIFLVTAVLSGCSVLDMRCEDVSDRIAMHAGSKWYAYQDDSKTADSARHNWWALKEEEQRGPPPSGYCARNHKDRQLANPVDKAMAGIIKPLSLSPPGGLPVCTWKGSVPAPDAPQNSQQAKDRYLYEKEIVFGADGIGLAGVEKKIPIVLINQSLNCVWDDPLLSGEWPCETIGNLKDLEWPDQDTKDVFAKCLVSRPPLMLTNYIGVIDGRYCLFIGIYEVKPRLKEDSDSSKEKDRHWPTNISYDRLKAEIWCAEKPYGDAQPGVVVVGPRLDSDGPELRDAVTFIEQ